METMDILALEARMAAQRLHYRKLYSSLNRFFWASLEDPLWLSRATCRQGYFLASTECAAETAVRAARVVLELMVIRASLG
jgi:hypothetical protein